jgi:lipopolysaccharide transport system ATP-binding protein
MPTPVIEINNLSKRFVLSHEGEARYKSFREVLTEKATFWKKSNTQQLREEFWALKDVSFQVNAGDRIGIIGRNGAGKSTLLKILSRITEPTTGQIKIRGRVASLLEVGTGFHPELTGRENIFLNGAILGMGRSEIRKKFDEIVAFAEIEKFLDTPVKRYSSGMYVRLAFAVAAHLDPEILVVDEVLAVGDAQFQKKCLGKMEDVSRSEGRTVLFVSHQLGMVKSLCDKGLVLSKGNVAFTGSSSAAIDYYINNALEKNNETVCYFDENADLNAQILSCKLSNAANEGQLRFDVFEDIYLHVTYIVRKPISGMNICYALDKNAETLGYSFDTDFNESLLNQRDPGIYTFRVKLPHPLKAGQYQISTLSLGIVNLGAFNIEKNLFSFEIVEESFDPTYKSFSSNRDGILVFSNEWEQLSYNPK